MLVSISTRTYISKLATLVLLVKLFCSPVLPFEKQIAETQLSYSSLSSAVALCTDIQFKQAPQLATEQYPKSVAAADFDGDGKTDIVTTFSFNNGGFSIIRNLDSNHFAPRVDIMLPQGFGVESIFTKDLDGDDKIDVVLSATFSPKILVFKNTSSGPGVISFASGIEYAVGGGQARSIAFGDFDADGSPDISVAIQDMGLPSPNLPSSISILRNISAGTGNIAFEPSIIYPQRYVTVVTTADFDGDGKLDIVAAGNHSFGVRVMRNISSGIGNINFSTSDLYAIPNVARGIVAADFDTDGKVDIATSASIGNKISVLRNTSSGSGNINFANRQDFDTGSAPFGAVSADFDGDGKVDIATANSNGNSVSILRNTSSATGNISFAARPWDFGVGIGPYNLATGDFNSDGKLDVITVNGLGNTLSILINNRTSVGSVDFVARKDYLALSNAGVTNVASADFDGDGNLDLAASFDEVMNVFAFSIYRNDGSGHFPTRVDIPTSASGFEPYFLSAADFDNDGKPDLVMQTSFYFRVYRNTSTGIGNISFALANFYASPSSPSGRITIVDLDNDGKKDVITTANQSFGANATMMFLFNTSPSSGSISFSQTPNFDLPEGSVRIHANDLDGDNKIDLAYIGSGTNSYIILQRQISSSPGQISFSQQNISEFGISFLQPISGDLDEDGKPELVSRNNNSSGTFSVFKNISSPGILNFAPRIVLPAFSLFPRLIADINNDGKNDIVVSNSAFDGSYISVLKNTSSGAGNFSFQPSMNYAIGSHTNATNGQTSIIVDDFNNDGRLDVVTGFKDSFTGVISVLLNQECATNRPTVFDYDGDGKADVSVFRPSNGSWYSQQSANGFTGVNFGQNGDKIVPTDYDGDGKTDVAVFRAGTWYLQRSQAGFTGVSFGEANDIPIPADYDGDGKSDIAVFRPSTGVWYLLRSQLGFTGVSFGQIGDKPVPADYDGDGKADIAVYRNGTWYLQRSQSGFTGIAFGEATDKPVPADYDGDGKADIAVFRPSNGTWYLQRSQLGFTGIQFGLATDLPVPADYDGDGKTDIAVFRDGNWYLNRSSAGFTGVSFGSPSDKPVPNAFIH